MTGWPAIDPGLVLATGVFVGVLLAFQGLRLWLGRSGSTAARAERRARARSTRPTAGVTLPLAPIVPRPGLTDRLRQFLEGAGVGLSPVAFVSVVAGAGLAAFCLLVLVLPPIWALTLALPATLLLPGVIVLRMRQARQEKLTTQLPDALDLMSRALKVGHPLNTSMASVAAEMGAPIAEEFGRMVDQVTYGEDVVSAFRDMAARNRSEDLDYLAAAVAIQHGTGGSLSRILDILARTIRERANLRRKIMAVSAEGRISALILSLLPFGVVALTHFTSPTYYGGVAGHPDFAMLAALVGVLIVANMLIMRKLVSFRI